MCECYKIGGRFIEEDPSCPVHGLNGSAHELSEQHNQIQELQDQIDEMRAQIAELFRIQGEIHAKS